MCKGRFFSAVPSRGSFPARTTEVSLMGWHSLAWDVPSKGEKGKGVADKELESHALGIHSLNAASDYVEGSAKGTAMIQNSKGIC